MVHVRYDPNMTAAHSMARLFPQDIVGVHPLSLSQLDALKRIGHMARFRRAKRISAVFVDQSQ